MSSSENGKTPCPHNHQHNFKQEIEESIRRCEQLLSVAPPVLYHPTCITPEGRGSSSTRRSSRSSARLSSEYSSSGAEPETKSADFDPEWRKNMGLLINVQDGNVTTVTPVITEYEEDLAALPTPVDEEGNPPDERIETEYNFSFDESKHSTGTDTVPDSINITTRTLTRGSGSDLTSESDEWHYEIMEQSRSPSSASGIASQSSSKSRPASYASKSVASRRFSKTNSPGSSTSQKSNHSRASSKSKSGPRSATGSDTSGGRTAKDPRSGGLGNEQHSEVASGSVTRSERETARVSPNRRERGNEECCSHRREVITTRSQDGNHEIIFSERCTTFPRHRASPTPPSSPYSSVKFSTPPKSPIRKTPPNPRSPRSPRRPQQDPDRILHDAIAFTFNTPHKFNEDWEWVGECTGVRTGKHAYQGTNPKPQT
ncbi:hypothetical protein R1sor_027292 [Riccia sorocarpa]|uniref:Uncharacterized protein n=1 Tax=Riccia sorocarpa TaxID=122646 RepID=A0ABD3GJJ1_9MARC